MAIFPPFLQYTQISELITLAYVEFQKMVTSDMKYDSCPVEFILRNRDTTRDCETFKHLISTNHSDIKKRVIDVQRTKRIHWIKNLLDDYPDARIEYYLKLHKNTFRVIFVVPNYSYLLVIEQKTKSPKCFYIITAYHLSNKQEISYQMRNVRKFRDNNFNPIE